MSATDRSSRFPRAVVILVPLLAALGGCVALPLMELAATPTSSAAPCATAGDPAAGCNGGGMSSMIPGMANVMQMFAPGTTASH